MKVGIDIPVRRDLVYTWLLYRSKDQIRGSYASKLDGESYGFPAEEP